MRGQPQGTPRRGRGLVAAVLLAAVVAAAALLPYLPAGPDLYVHVLWTWQVMRCVAAGDLPVWLPDLNAGFGSPGIRLYSPLGPVLEGVLGLALGGAGAALRVAPVLAWAAFLLVVLRRRGTRAGAIEWTFLLVAPLTLHSLLGRGAWSEYLAVPLLWWLLDAAVEGDLRGGRDGALLAVLWLLHAPTTLMAVCLMGAAAAARRDLRLVGRLAAACVLAAAMTAWHWLPLAAEMRLVDRAALTGGIFATTRNALGSPVAHALDENIWLGWCAVALLVAALAGRWWRTDPRRTALLAACVALASPLAAWLYRLPLPLDMLQFPWRWLLPAAVVAAAVAARAAVDTRGRLALVVAVLPLVAFAWPAVVDDPGLTARTEWREAGERVSRAFDGNPLVVDAAQNRPASWGQLGANLQRFGPRAPAVGPDGARWQVERWEPLERRLVVECESPARVALRVLDYPFWEVTVDGAPASARSAGTLAASVPAGRHVVRARWAGNPLAAVGRAAAAVALGLVALVALRARRRRPGGDGAGR